MMRTKRAIISILLIFLLLFPFVAFAEGDYEEGDGWVYQDGKLTITDNRGLINFLYHEEDMLADPNHKHTAGDVERVVIGKDVSDIVIDYYIGDYNPSNIMVEEGNQDFIIDNGWVVNKTTNTLFGAANAKQNKTRSEIDDLPTYIEHIGMYAFSDCSELKEITIPERVVSIGESSFYGCSSLESITLPCTVTSIGTGSFSGCTSLNHVDFGPNVKEVGAAAFDVCIHLETPPFYNMKLDTIYGNSFWGCDAFQTVEFPSTLRVVENQAFAHSSGLTSLVFNSDQLIIENGAFDACDNIRKLIFTKGVPISIGRVLFGEDEKTPDGKSFITRLYDKSGKVIPYPTIYYTSAYANQWAPNGETEWNGYSIQQISQEELDAIRTEAREVPIPTPTVTAAPTAEPVIEAPVTPQKATVSEIAEMICHAILLFEMAKFAAAITVLIALKMKNRQKKNNAPKENSYVRSVNADSQDCVPQVAKHLPAKPKHSMKIMKKLMSWLAGILFTLIIFFALLTIEVLVDILPRDVTEATEATDATENSVISCSASAVEYIDPVTAQEYLDVTVIAPEGSVVRIITNVALIKNQVTVDAANSAILRINQDALLPWTPLETNTILITPNIEVTLPTGEVVRPSLPSMFEKVPVLEVFITDPPEEVIEIPEDQQTIRIAGYVNYSNDIPVYVNNEQVYVDDAGNFESEIDLTQLDDDSSNSGNNGLSSDAEKTITIEARMSNCKTARKTITIHRIPIDSTN